MKLRVKFTKEDYLKYISHLDLMRLFHRAFRRADIPVKHSQGFNPQPKLSIANPLALGIESAEEYMEIELYDKIPENKFIVQMNKDLPKEINILDAKYVESKKSISSLISWAYYEIRIIIKSLQNIETLNKQIEEWITNDEIIIKTIKKKKKRIIERDKDIKPFIANVVILRDDSYKICQDEYIVTINCLLKSGDNGNLRPVDFLKGMKNYLNLDMDIDLADIKRLNIFAEVDGKISSPM